jgi:hypothetical protein
VTDCGGGEPAIDVGGKGRANVGEPAIDVDGKGHANVGEPAIDVDGKGRANVGEPASENNGVVRFRLNVFQSWFGAPNCPNVMNVHSGQRSM